MIANLFIIGTHKSGTTSLFRYLSDHNEINPSKKKEIHYFTPLRYENKIKSIDYYNSFFSKSNCKYNLDASPSYFYSKKISKKIHSLNEDSKLILILRNPTNRFISFYKMIFARYLMKNQISFEKFLDLSFKHSMLSDKDIYTYRALREGNYHNYLGHWKKYKNNLRVIFFENLIENPKKTMLDLCDFLEIESDIYNKYSFDVHNKNFYSRSSWFFKAARLINKTFENLFNNEKKLKRKLKRVYEFINSKNQSINIENKHITQINKYYQRNNSILKKYILKFDFSFEKFPDWVK